MRVKSVEDVKRLGNYMGAIVLDAESRVAEVNANMLEILEKYPAGSINFTTMNAIMKDIIPIASTTEMEPIEKNGRTVYPQPDKSCLDDPRFLNKISTFTKEEQEQILEGIRISAKFGPKIRMFKDAQEILLSPAPFSDRQRDYATILQNPNDPSDKVFNDVGYENYLLYVQRYAPRQVQNFHMFADRNTKAVLSHHYYKMSTEAYSRYLNTYSEASRMPEKEADMRKRIKNSMGSSTIGGYRPLSQIKVSSKQTYSKNLRALTREDRSYHGAASEIGNVLQIASKYVGQKAADALSTPRGKKVLIYALCAFLAASAGMKAVHSNDFANRYVESPASISDLNSEYGMLSADSIEKLQSNQDLINEIIKQGVNVDGDKLSQLRDQLDSSINYVVDDLFHDAVQDYYNGKYKDDDRRNVTDVSLFYDLTDRYDHRTGLMVSYKDRFGIDHTGTIDIEKTPIQDLFVKAKGGRAASLSGLVNAERTLDVSMKNLISQITDQNLSFKERQKAFNRFLDYANDIQGGMRIAASNTPEIHGHLFIRTKSIN